MVRFIFQRVEKRVGKEENAGDQLFLHFQQCYLLLSYSNVTLSCISLISCLQMHQIYIIMFQILSKKINIPTAINNASPKVHDVVFVFLTKGII